MIETSVRFGVTLVRVTFSGQATPDESKEYQLQLKKKDSYALQPPFCTQWTRAAKDSKALEVMESVSYESVIVDMVEEAKKGRLNSNKVVASLVERMIPVTGDQHKKQSKKKKAQQEVVKQIGSVAFDLSYFVVPFEASSWKSVDFQLTATDELILTDIKDSHHLFALSSEQNSSTPNSDQANNTNSIAGGNNETNEAKASAAESTTALPTPNSNNNSTGMAAKSPRQQEKKAQALRAESKEEADPYRHKPRRSRTIGDFEKESAREKANQASSKEKIPRRKSDEVIVSAGERTMKVGQVIPDNTAKNSQSGNATNTSNATHASTTLPRHAKSTPTLQRNNMEEGKGKKGKKKSEESDKATGDAAHKESDKSPNKFALIASLTDLKSKFSSAKSLKSVSPRSERDKENRSRKNAQQQPQQGGTDGVSGSSSTHARGNNFASPDSNTTHATSTTVGANQSTATGEVKSGYGTVKNSALTENKFVDVSDWNMTDWKTQDDKLDSILIKPNSAPSISTSPNASIPEMPTSQPTTPVNSPPTPTYASAPTSTANRPHAASHSHSIHLTPQPQPQLLKFKDGKGGGLQTSPNTSPRTQKVSAGSEPATSNQSQRTAPIPIPQPHQAPQQQATAVTENDSSPHTPSPSYTNTTSVRDPVLSSNPSLVLPSPLHPSNAITPPLSPVPSSPRTHPSKPKPLPSPRTLQAHSVQPTSPRSNNISTKNANESQANESGAIVIGAIAIPSSASSQHVTIGATTVALATSPPSPRHALLGTSQASSSPSCAAISPPSPRFGTPIAPTTSTTNASSTSPRTLIAMAIDAAEEKQQQTKESSNNNNDNATTQNDTLVVSSSSTLGGRLRLTDNYTPLSFVVHGDWKPHAELLKGLGGKWVPSLASPPYKGWLFVAKRRDEVLQHIGHLLDHSPYVPSLPNSPRDLDFQPQSTATVSSTVPKTTTTTNTPTIEQISANDLVRLANVSQSNSSSNLMTKSTAGVNPYRFSCDDKIDTLLDNLTQTRIEKQHSPRGQTTSAVPKLALIASTQSVNNNSNSTNVAAISANNTAPVSPHQIKGVTPPTGNRLRSSISMASPPVSVERMIDGLLVVKHVSETSSSNSNSKDRKTSSDSEQSKEARTSENGTKQGAGLDANLLGMIDDIYALVTEGNNGDRDERREALAAITGASEGLERGEEAGVEILSIIEDILFQKRSRLSGSGESHSQSDSTSEAEIEADDEVAAKSSPSATTDATVPPERKLSGAALGSARAKQMLKKLSLPILPSIPLDAVQEEKNAVFESIHQFLKPLNLSDFTEAFFANGWTVPELYGDMCLDDLTEMGFKKGHLNTWRKRVNSAIS